jgi:hypothetical protein
LQNRVAVNGLCAVPRRPGRPRQALCRHGDRRASGKDDGVRLTPLRKMTLEQAIAYIQDASWSR